MTTKNTGSWITWIIIAAIVIAIFVAISPSKEEQEKAIQNKKENYVASIAKWIEIKNSKTLSATVKKEIAECVYEEDSYVLYYRKELKDREEKANENRVIKVSQYAMYGDFLTDLESYVNGGEGKIMQEEANRINAAIKTCKEKLGY